jgi:thioredoxin reductase
MLPLDKDTAGEYIRNIELIENYPGYAGGISGARLAAEMVAAVGDGAIAAITARRLLQEAE